mmetsp:Transcript_59638/g.69106  ORF Transcript_59638/g.69106 Transcript_59638/m.69106 type:complete len:93 (+) Transcript_59638:62-340(+)
MLRREASEVRTIYEAEAKHHTLLSLASLLPACVFVAEVMMGGMEDASDVLNVVAAVWQPLLHVAVRMIVMWMFESYAGVLRLLASSYRHEGA